jgi:hypothetical protein
VVLAEGHPVTAVIVRMAIVYPTVVAAEVDPDTTITVRLALADRGYIIEVNTRLSVLVCTRVRHRTVADGNPDSRVLHDVHVRDRNEAALHQVDTSPEPLDFPVRDDNLAPNRTANLTAIRDAGPRPVTQSSNFMTMHVDTDIAYIDHETVGRICRNCRHTQVFG